MGDVIPIDRARLVQTHKELHDKWWQTWNKLVNMCNVGDVSPEEFMALESEVSKLEADLANLLRRIEGG